MSTCPHCGQRIIESREPQGLTEREATLFRMIRAAGSTGISSEALAERLPGFYELENPKRNVWVHINNMRKKGVAINKANRWHNGYRLG